MHYRGHPNWKLVGLAGGADVPAIGAALLSSSSAGATDDAASSAAAGRITSAAASPALHRALCLGYVRATLATVGAEFSVREGGHTASLTVVELPLKGDPPHA
jgi:glycine cleavage system aminomethyltransferase T